MKRESVLSLLRLAHLVRRIYWRLWKPNTLGSRCIIVEDRKVLLVKHVYEPWWYLPGGGVKRGESFENAVRREVWEEAGLTVGTLTLLGLYHSRAEGKNDHVAVFVADDFEGSPRNDSYEIESVEWFPVDRLPTDASPATRRRMAEYLGGQRARSW